MIKKSLSNITLCMVNTVDANLGFKVLLHSMQHFEFGKILLFTDVAPLIPAPITDAIKEEIKKINIYQIDKLSWLDYNRFILFKLNDYITTDHVLICQTDGFIINPHLWTEEFLNYDYIGSTWSETHLRGCKWLKPEIKERGKFNVVGNGGFSLRSKKLLKLTQECGIECDGPEDAFICNNNYEYFVSKGLVFAPVKIADMFSREQDQNNNISYEQTFGFHGPRDAKGFIDKHILQ